MDNIISESNIIVLIKKVVEFRKFALIFSLLTLGTPHTYAQSRQIPNDNTPTNQELRKQARLEKKHQKEQLQLKSDSIKISAMLQLRNTTGPKEVDSLKKVMKNSKKLAKESLLKSNEAKKLNPQLVGTGKEPDPYLEQYKKYKSKLALDSGNLPDYASQAGTDGLLNEGKQAGLQELKKKEEYKDLTKDLQPYTTQLKKYKGKGNPLDSANQKQTLKDAKNLGLKEFGKNEEYKSISKDLQPYSKELKKLKGKGNPLDSANRQVLLQDAKQLGLKELEKKEEFKNIKKELSPYLDSPYLKGIKLQDLDSMSLDSLKSLSVSTFQKLEKRLEQELLKTKELSQFNKDMGEMEALKGLPESYKKQFEKYKNGEGLQKEAMAEAAKKAQALLSKHSKEIQSAQTQLAKLKKKYSSVQSSNDLSTATKRNSLQGKLLKERIVLGINFQIVSLDPVIIDFNPLLGYKFNKKFYVAVGGSYRARFTESRANSPAQGGQAIRIGQDELTYGYRAFTEYNVWKMLSIHAEYERISKEFEIGKTDTFERKWVAGALAGISSNYTLKGKVKGNFSVLYNFLHNDAERVYQSPWVFRFGLSR